MSNFDKREKLKEIILALHQNENVDDAVLSLKNISKISKRMKSQI